MLVAGRRIAETCYCRSVRKYIRVLYVVENETREKGIKLPFIRSLAHYLKAQSSNCSEVRGKWSHCWVCDK